MDIAFIIFFIPFCIPLLILMLVSLYLNKNQRLVVLAEKIFTFSPLLWAFPILTIPLARTWYDTKTAGTMLTLLVPNVIFFFAYLPEFVLIKHTVQRSLYNGLFAIISTLIFWQLTIKPSNWGEGALAFIFIIPALIGMIVFTSVVLKFRSKMRTFTFKVLLIISIILLSATIARRTHNYNYEHLESSSKTQFFEATSRYLTEHGSENFSQAALIDSGSLKGIYEIKKDIIINKYGGTVSINLLGDVVSVVYTQIPAKDPCFAMYFISSPSSFGFEEIYVSGVNIGKVFKSTSEIEDTKQQVCFSSSEPKTIEFRGRVQKIRQLTEKLKTMDSHPPVKIEQNPLVAEKIFSHFSKLPQPKDNASEFEHWTYSTALFSTIDCWQNLNSSAPLPKLLSVSKPTQGGVWSLPSATETLKFCQSLAEHGIKPVCTNSFALAKGVERKPGLPSDYIQVYEVDPLQIEGTLSCYLTPDRIGKQEFAGKLNATWIEKPRIQKINFSNGPMDLMVGTIMISLPQAPGLNGQMYQEPKMAVVISK